ncbi:ABC transporter permease [Armatimonas sp.]|uniref:ABC transporter permease n=1 Tax=Armatimonas sp. TaxID=1872638 RepID=UPI00374D8B0F
MQNSSLTARLRAVVLPVVTAGALYFLLAALTRRLPGGETFPTPLEVGKTFMRSLSSGELPKETWTSLWRVVVAYGLAAFLGLPLGVALGRVAPLREALLPVVNFLRAVSPLSWIPFAILWFGLGNPPVIFLVFGATFPPLVLGTMAATLAVPQIYFRVGRDYGLSVFAITLPAILPQVFTTLRVTAGLAWVVIVAAEMVSREGGLGFLIHDARNGQMLDLAIVGIIAIGTLGILTDRLLGLLGRLPAVRWGYER